MVKKGKWKFCLINYMFFVKRLKKVIGNFLDEFNLCV